MIGDRACVCMTDYDIITSKRGLGALGLRVVADISVPVEGDMVTSAIENENIKVQVQCGTLRIASHSSSHLHSITIRSPP